MKGVIKWACVSTVAMITEGITLTVNTAECVISVSVQTVTMTALYVKYTK